MTSAGVANAAMYHTHRDGESFWPRGRTVADTAVSRSRRLAAVKCSRKALFLNARDYPKDVSGG